MLKSVRGQSGWHHKDYRVIYKLWSQKTMKQDESNGDPKFTTKIKLEDKLLNHLKTNIKHFWKWRRMCRAYINPILKFDVGQMNS